MKNGYQIQTKRKCKLIWKSVAENFIQMFFDKQHIESTDL